MQTKTYYKLFYSEKKRLKPLKVVAAKKSFPSVRISDVTSFDEYFLFHVITGRQYFLYKFIVIQRYGTTAMLLRSLKQIF